VLAHYGGDVTLANVQPSKRAKILAKYGRPAAAAAAPAA
jgi:alkane 1-monooxygenase